MDKRENKKVTIEEVTISNMYEIEAIIRVLEKKGLLTHQEVLEELKIIKAEHNSDEKP